MAYEIMKNKKVNTESQSVKTAHDKGVNSTDLLGGVNRENQSAFLALIISEVALHIVLVIQVH